jgi:hypothetical protein
MAVTYVGRGVSNGIAGEFVDQAFGAAFFNFSVQDGLTALAGGGQTGATSVAQYQISRFTTVATTADSCVLGFSMAGHWRCIINAGANAMNVYPRSGDQINALGANNPFSIPAGKTCLLFCPLGGSPAGGIWNTLLSA